MHDIKDVCESQFPNKWKMNERSEFEKCTRVVGWRHRHSPWSSLMQIWQMTWNCYIQVDAWVVVSYYEELSKVWMLVAPHSSRYWNRLLCSPSSRPGGRELSCKLGNYFGLRKLGSGQQLREIDIGQIPYLVIMVVSFWVLSPSQLCKKFATWFSNGNIQEGQVMCPEWCGWVGWALGLGFEDITGVMVGSGVGCSSGVGSCTGADASFSIMGVDGLILPSLGVPLSRDTPSLGVEVIIRSSSCSSIFS